MLPKASMPECEVWFRKRVGRKISSKRESLEERGTSLGHPFGIITGLRGTLPLGGAIHSAGQSDRTGGGLDLLFLRDFINRPFTGTYLGNVRGHSKCSTVVPDIVGGGGLGDDRRPNADRQRCSISTASAAG